MTYAAMKYFVSLSSLILALMLLLTAQPSEGPAEQPDGAVADARSVLEAEAAADRCVQPSYLFDVERMLASASDTGAMTCSVEAQCQDSSTRSCSDTSSPFQCAGVNANCPSGVRGYVQCNGQSKDWCPVCDCHNVCQPCASYGQTDDCGLTCTLGACGRVAAWILEF